ncbi:hypothetical protein [Pollutibacter soli]|uniref:hypothetical protein n=1 Tax=Pollutibacter soli TaxID=3034157 RepID=UPI0030139B72
MKNNADILNELRSISHRVAEVSDSMPYRVPPGYFEQFPDSVLKLVRKVNFKVEFPNGEFSALKNATENILVIPFDVPEGYFESFADRMLGMVKSENEIYAELKELSPFLAGVPKTNPFSAPEGYFNNLKVNIPEKVEEKPAGKLISLNTWKKFAVAAAVIGIIFTGALFLFKSNGTSESNPDIISISAMENFLNTDDMDFPAPPIPESEELALLDINENTIGSLLETVNDAAITEFMKDNPGADISTSVN